MEEMTVISEPAKIAMLMDGTEIEYDFYMAEDADKKWFSQWIDFDLFDVVAKGKILSTDGEFCKNGTIFLFYKKKYNYDDLFRMIFIFCFAIIGAATIFVLI